MGIVHHQKLVRDLIPERLVNKGIKVVARTLNEDEYLACLLDKLVEESKEALIAENEMSLKEELADIQEVINAILEATNTDKAEVEAIRTQKAAERGTFKKRIFLETTEE